MGRNRGTRRALVMAAVGTCMGSLLLAGAAGTAHAQERGPSGFGSWAALWEYQGRMNALAGRVVALGGEGFGGVVADPDTRRLRVHWKGAVPAELAALAASAPADIPVVVERANFSRAELLAAAREVARVDGVTSVGPRPDGSGLAATVAGPSTSAVTAADGIPVQVTPGVRTAPMLASRQGDSAPYWGGGRFRIGNGACTTGFAIIHGGRSKLLSAGHCGANGNAAVDGDGDRMGAIEGDSNSRDTLLVDARGGGSVFVGGWQSSRSKSVASARASVPGNYICTSGASSGEHCSIRVKAVDQTFNIGYPVYPTIAAEHPVRACAVAPGDSGGPVIAYRADGRVDALGTMVGGVMDTPCEGASPTGSYRVWYTDLPSALRHYGASIVMG